MINFLIIDRSSDDVKLPEPSTRKNSRCTLWGYLLSLSVISDVHRSHGELCFPNPNSSEPISNRAEFSNKNHSYCYLIVSIFSAFLSFASLNDALQPPALLVRSTRCSLTFIVNPQETCTTYGIGFDSFSDDYKIISFLTIPGMVSDLNSLN
ncbi:hypothetical protein Cgig2_016256 [Carnegiea gigantea]|uniref:Uncharacterized protein n=1 Tax=Carnegiea gigantea TaxID=171969 RepID=A0A9Q1KFV2_9CARY|nr:hypothetical protein Cgig2_016256 [Carnegiea gigantea]